MVRFKVIDSVDAGYRVGDDGSVWSRRRTLHVKGISGSVGGLVKNWRLLKPGKIPGHNHWVVALRTNGVMKSHYVHRLVLLSFVGPCPDGMECRHLDGNPDNNKLSNLCWGSRKENVEDMRKHGSLARGDRHGNARLTEENVRYIKRVSKNRKRGDSTSRRLSDKFGIPQSTICCVLNGSSWAWVK